MSEFDTAKFLDLLADDCADSEREGKQFQADPSLLGPRLVAASKRFGEQEHYLNALLENHWVVAKSPEDGLWRVWSGDTGKIVGDQKRGHEDRMDAIDFAIIAKYMPAAAPQPDACDPSQSSD